MIALVVAVVASVVSFLAVFGFDYRRDQLSPRIVTATLLMLSAGVLFLLWAQRGLTQHAVYQDWPTTEGRVLRAEVIGTRAFRPLIVYEYQYAGKFYRDSTSLDPPGFGGRNNKENAARTIAAGYPPGKLLRIHIDPADVSKSRLRTSPTWDLYGHISLGGLLLAAGLFPFFGRARRMF